jgi:hypothetical protein
MQKKDSLSEGWRAEQISGPHYGYFLGSYVTLVEGGFVAYTKVFSHRPDTPWDNCCHSKHFGASADSYAEAIAAAIELALKTIRRWHRVPAVDVLPPIESISACTGAAIDIVC